MMTAILFKVSPNGCKMPPQNPCFLHSASRYVHQNVRPQRKASSTVYIIHAQAEELRIFGGFEGYQMQELSGMAVSPWEYFSDG